MIRKNGSLIVLVIVVPCRTCPSVSTAGKR